MMAKAFVVQVAVFGLRRVRPDLETDVVPLLTSSMGSGEGSRCKANWLCQ
jgi:hypothetical protein